MRFTLLFSLLCLLVAPVHAATWQTPPSWPKLFADAGVQGTMLVYDEAADRWSVFDEKRARHAYSPASTFKLFNALVALDTGAVKDEYDVIRWDGTERKVFGKPLAEWNRDNSLASGMRYSTLWFYKEIARRAGQARMQAFVDKAGYGNRDISGGIDRFWIDGGMRISAEQQVAFLRGLADGKLPFSARAQEAVRRISITDAGVGYTLHGKTGYGDKAGNDGADVGWFVGYTEYQGKRWFFALNVDVRKPIDGTGRIPLAKSLLVSLGALPAAAQ